MTSSSNTKSFLGSLLIIILFVIACLFFYWAVEYWVRNNFDKGRYEMSKIQPQPGVDSWSLWKLDRRTGRIEYCSLNYVIASDGSRQEQFTCIPAMTPEDRKKEAETLRSSVPVDQQAVETETVVTTTSSTPNPAPAPVVAPAPAPVPAP